MARRRTNTRDLTRLLSGATLPIYALSEQRRIVYCNPACAAWLECEADQLLGERCDYHSAAAPTRAATLAAALCPSPAVFQGEPAKGLLTVSLPSGELSRRQARFLPLGPDAIAASGVLALVDAHEQPADPPADAAIAGEPGPEQLHQELADFQRQLANLYQPGRLIGDSPAMRRVRQQIALAAGARSRAIVVGPPGSGREHVARTIHYTGQQEPAGPLTPVPSPLVDAELLQASITAFSQRAAQVETGRHGTLLLLEVDQLPEDAQRELAGFLSLPDFRLAAIGTARRSLLELAAEGKYRADVAYALSTLVIELPPLAQRRADLPKLAQMLLEELNAGGGRQVGGFSPEALDALADYHWPGGVEELAEVIRAAHRAVEGPLVLSRHLPKLLRLAAEAAAQPSRPPEPIVLDDYLLDVERELIRRALAQAKGNKSRAARLLGMTRARLHRRVDQWGLDG